MKNLLFTLLAIAFLKTSSAQTEQSTINFNTCSAIVSNSGTLFTDPVNFTAGYEYPKGSGKTLIYSSSFMFGATDVNGDTLLSSTTFQPDVELFNGPHSATNNYPTQISIWTMAKSDVDYHIANYSQPGYTLTARIEFWPGNGDALYGQNSNLAPFVDVNNNNIYEPLLGDYPDIRGDFAKYIIMNDSEKSHTNSNTAPLGIEVHLMFYQYTSSDYLDSTTFINMRVYNYSTNDYTDFVSSIFLDADIGYYADDFLGCDSTKNLVYGYNGDAFDENNGGGIGYGATPACLGIVSLNQDISSFLTYSGGSFFPYSIPSTKSGIWNVMHGKWQDGTPIYYGGTGTAGSTGVTSTPTNFQYSGNPNSPGEWSEINVNNPPGDRRAILSIKEANLPAGGSQCYDFAVIANMQSDNLTNVQNIYNISDQVQSFYDNQNFNCNQVTVGIEENELNTFQVYPNPNEGVLNIKNRMTTNEIKITITDISGRTVYQKQLDNKPIISLGFNQQPGSYFITITSNNDSATKSIILK